MTCNDLKSKLEEAFSEDIYEFRIDNANELYATVNPDRAFDICVYCNAELCYPLISMFANDEKSLCGKYAVYYVFANRENALLLIIKITLDESKMEICSITERIPAAALYEREMQDLFGIVPLGHPDAKRLVLHGNWPEGEFPLRKEYDGKHKPDFVKNETKFQTVSGEGVYEIPVGPVHAGIIEPGHFRFSVAGGPIINLEAQLYFVHKGIEKMCEGISIERCLYVSERISGDETFANSLAYCQAIEKIAGIRLPIRAQFTRVVFAELERLTSHLGDLGGVCTDVAYGFAAYQFQMMRGWAYGIADELCGMRFLRSVNKLGGLRKEFICGKESSIIEQLERIRKELEDTEAIIKSNSMYIDRVEHTGILRADIAADLNAVGPGGRASGMYFDVRKSFPYEVYKHLDFKMPEHYNGDVNCRVNTKLEECFEAISLMKNAIEKMPDGEVCEPIETVAPYRYAFGITEAPRGEDIHWVMTGENNTVFRYKIRTPSFCNWPVLCHAVKGNTVTDFPLINKSFNLSYAGNDL